MLRKTAILVVLTLVISNLSGCSFKQEAKKNVGDSQSAESDKKENLLESRAINRTNTGNEPAGLTGTYRYKSGGYNNAITVDEQSKNRLRVSIAANYEYKVDGEWMANSGSAHELVTLSGDTAALVPADFTGCQITLKFSGNKIFVKQTGTETDCGFGANTSAEGTYLKTSSELNANGMDDEAPRAADNPSSKDDERIRFATGRSSAVVSGKITGDEREKTYLVGAKAGQTLDVKITEDSQNNDVVFYIVAPDGSHPMGDEEEDGGYDSVWSGKLKKTGDYKIVVSTIESQNVNFKMSVAIR